MKGLGMPGTGARIKRKPLRCQWKVASLPFLVLKATPAKARADAPVARVARAGQEARLALRAAQVPRVAQALRVAQEAQMARAAHVVHAVHVVHAAWERVR